MGAKVRAYDPVGMAQAKDLLPNVAFCDGPYDCVEEADAAVIVTEWEQFRALDLTKLRDLMACPVVVDLRNVYRPEDMKNAGFASPADACRAIWRDMSAPSSEALFRMFFEAYAMALRHPRRFSEFLNSAVEDWLSFLADPLLLQEILWNLFTNIRYGLPTLGNGGNTRENSARVGCSISFSGETTAGTRARVHVEVVSPANSSLGKPTKTNTWFRHEQEIKRYGGELRYRESPTIVTASLDLIKME